MNILIAEDDRATAQLLSSRLNKMGHTTTVAFDTMQTMMSCRRFPAPDLLMLDIQMPGGSGLQVLQRVRSAPRTATLPVIVLTSNAENERAALEGGADAFLLKPPDFDRLGSILGRFQGAVRPKHVASPTAAIEPRQLSTTETSATRPSALLRNVLVVEDDRVTADLLATRLKRAGFACIFASDVPDALRVLNSFRIDGVLLDMSLPSGSGLDVIQRMKSFSRNGNTPVFVISAETDKHATQFALSAGASRYFHKPAEPDEVIAALQAAF